MFRFRRNETRKSKSAMTISFAILHDPSRQPRRKHHENWRQEFSDGRSAHRSQLPDRRQCCHRQQLFAGRSCSRRRRCFLGGGSTFHQFMHIGRLVMVQGSSGFERSATVRRRRGAQLRLRAEYRWNAPRWAQRERSRRNQGGIQTCLPKRTKHVAGSRESGDDDLWRTSPRIPGLRCQCKKAGDLPVQTRHRPRRFGLATQTQSPRCDGQPPCTGGMIAISSPGFSG